MEELIDTIHKFKRRKAPGPDEIPMEAYMEMLPETLEHLRTILNRWWSTDDFPEELAKARVVLIYKKGATKDLNNYRPISLLNRIYTKYTLQ